MRAHLSNSGRIAWPPPLDWVRRKHMLTQLRGTERRSGAGMRSGAEHGFHVVPARLRAMALAAARVTAGRRPSRVKVNGCAWSLPPIGPGGWQQLNAIVVASNAQTNGPERFGLCIFRGMPTGVNVGGPD